MQPQDALAYLANVASDFARTLPPSAAMPFQQAAQDAVNTLAALVNPPAIEPPPPGERAPLHAVELARTVAPE